MAPFLESMRVHAAGDTESLPKRFVFVVKSSGLEKFNLVPQGLTNNYVVGAQCPQKEPQWKYQKQKKIVNYANTIQGKIHNKKDEISWDLIKKIYKNNNYISPCHASSLFGVITPDGKVYPCEILEDKLIGDLRDFDMDFLKLWNTEKNKEIKNFIIKSKCKCTYECAMSFNILGNWRYQHKLLSSLISFY